MSQPGLISSSNPKKLTNYARVWLQSLWFGLDWQSIEEYQQEAWFSFSREYRLCGEAIHPQ
jgi:hypothetical protein